MKVIKLVVSFFLVVTFGAATSAPTNDAVRSMLENLDNESAIAFLRGYCGGIEGSNVDVEPCGWIIQTNCNSDVDECGETYTFVFFSSRPPLRFELQQGTWFELGENSRPHEVKKTRERELSKGECFLRDNANQAFCFSIIAGPG